MFVPVKSPEGQPLMPTTPSRARRWIKTGKATPYWDHGVFCVRLNAEPSGKEVQPIAVGIDPGSKKEGYTVKSASHTYLNVQADAVTWVHDAVEVRRNMRMARRRRKTPCRPCRTNRKGRVLPPSTKARWQWKLRIAAWLCRMFAVTDFVVEDVKARTAGQRRWDASFSPLQVGKHWFYEELAKLSAVHTMEGWETKAVRDKLGLKKSRSKMSNNFDAHCVDSWSLAYSFTGGIQVPDNRSLLLVVPMHVQRRQLHRLQPSKGGERLPRGGTRSMGLKKWSLVKHRKRGLCYVGGSSKGKVSLHSISDGRRLGQSFMIADCKFLCFSSWRANAQP